MNVKNIQSYLIPKILFGFAVIGFIILWLMFGGSTRYQHTSVDYDLSRLYPLVIGIALILPYFIYLFTSKSKRKKVLSSNPLDLNKIGMTTVEYFEKKSKENIFEIYVKNETSSTLIANRNSLLKPNSWYIFATDKHKPIYFNNGIEFHIDKELNLEIIDLRNQIIGLGDDYFKKNDVPEYVNWAFIIADPNQGDGME